MKTDDEKCLTCARNGAKSCKGRKACNYKRMTDSDPTAKPSKPPKTQKPKKYTKKQIADLDRLLLKWYAAGWSVNPRRVGPDDVVRLLTFLGAMADAAWRHCVRTGRAPAEDVSPSEGFALLSFAVLELARRGKVRSMNSGALWASYYDATAKSRNEAVRHVVKMTDKVVKGYFTE